METRNWTGINYVVNINNKRVSFKGTIEKMEKEAKEAKQKYRDMIDGSRANVFFLSDWINRIRYSQKAINEARSVSNIKEQKLNLLYKIMTTSAARVSIEVFNRIVNEELNGFSVDRKDAVLNARTAEILNDLYTAIGGREDGFFPQDLQEHQRRLAEAQMRIYFR